MIIIKHGNLLESNEDILGHQVNCLGVMGAGIAKQLKDKHPNVYVEYKDVVDNSTAKKLLGSTFLSKTPNNLIANLFSQSDIGTHRVQTDINALSNCLTRLKTYAKDNDLSVALPFGIGCGLGGGNWTEVYQLIDTIFRDYSVTLYKFQ